MSSKPGRRRTAASFCLGGLMVVATLAGCASISDLSFTKDTRLTLVAPANNSKATLPLEVTWSIRDFVALPPHLDEPDKRPSPTENSGYFAVFVDQLPMALGDDIYEYAADDRQCLISEGCPDADYFQSLAIYVTDQMSVTVPAFPSTAMAASSSSIGGTSYHTIYVVLLDSQGRRVSDRAWQTSVAVKDGGTG